jgi:multicomponent Na+:H+ antiporter subunit C
VSVLPWLVAAWLFAIGIYGILTSRNFIHLIGCLGVCQSSTYVLLLGIGYRWGGVVPVFYDQPVGTPAVDAVVQALVLTDIVVGATVDALLLAMVLQVDRKYGELDPQRLRPLIREGQK